MAEKANYSMIYTTGAVDFKAILGKKTWLQDL
jgi:hypothetical protein